MLSRWYFQCISCGWENSIEENEPAGFFCPKCNDLLQLVMKDWEPARDDIFYDAHISVWKYYRALPAEKKVTLGEGGTPLIKTHNLSKIIGLRNLYVKYEGLNPTGSFKDRGMTVAVSRAVECNAKNLVCASTGNTSASLAAYAARAGVKASVLIPEGKVAKGKLIQAVAYGARIIKVGGNFDLALEMLTKLVSEERNAYLVNSINPFRIEGQKTAAFEIYEQLGRIPDYVFLPVGNAGNISAIWKGFKELKEWGIIDDLPVMVGVQAAGAAPIAEAIREGYEKPRPWANPETIASAIRIGNPVSWKKAMRAVKESKGNIIDVSDSEIISWKNRLASMEGIFVEAASASPLAGVSSLAEQIDRGAEVVCIATGSGFKDQELVEWKPESFPTVHRFDELKNTLLSE